MINPFQKKPIDSKQTLGEILQAARAEKNIDLETASKHTKINRVFLTALEKGRYAALPSPVYIRNYVTVYAKYLGIPWDFIAEQYEKEIATYQDVPKALHEQVGQLLPNAKKQQTAKKIVVTRTREHTHAILVPQLVKFGVVGLLALAFLLYVTIQLVRLYNPPMLDVTNPASDFQTTTEKITIAGTTSPEATIEINGQRQDVGFDGQFSAELYVKDGLNTIRVTSQFKHSKKREVIRQVLFDAEAKSGQ